MAFATLANESENSIIACAPKQNMKNRFVNRVFLQPR
jgi:hypothetical protein